MVFTPPSAAIKLMKAAILAAMIPSVNRKQITLMMTEFHPFPTNARKKMTD